MKKIKPENNSSNIANANKGTKGTNKQNGQMNGNRSKQLQKGGKSHGKNK